MSSELKKSAPDFEQQCSFFLTHHRAFEETLIALRGIIAELELSPRSFEQPGMWRRDREGKLHVLSWEDLKLSDLQVQRMCQFTRDSVVSALNTMIDQWISDSGIETFIVMHRHKEAERIVGFYRGNKNSIGDEKKAVAAGCREAIVKLKSVIDPLLETMEDPKLENQLMPDIKREVVNFRRRLPKSQLVDRIFGIMIIRNYWDTRAACGLTADFCSLVAEAIASFEKWCSVENQKNPAEKVRMEFAYWREGYTRRIHSFGYRGGQYARYKRICDKGGIVIPKPGPQP